jgi:hypothetical protein
LLEPFPAKAFGQANRQSPFGIRQVGPLLWPGDLTAENIEPEQKGKSFHEEERR